MGRILLAAALAGFAGLLVVPAIAFALSLGWAHLPGGRCGASGDGSCATDALAIAMAVAVPGFALFFLVPVARAVRRRRTADRDFADAPHGPSGRQAPER